MSKNVLFVGGAQAPARQLADVLAQGGVMVAARPWTVWLRQGSPRRRPDLVVYNLTAPGVPSLERWAELPNHVADAPAMYITNGDPAQAEALGVVERLTTDWVANTAPLNEMRLRARRLLESPRSPMPSNTHLSNVTTDSAKIAPLSGRSKLLSVRRSPLHHFVAELHNTRSGRLDARAVSVLFGLTLADLARILGRSLATVHKTPDAPALQSALALYERIAAPGLRLTGSPEQLRGWLNAPNPELEEETPLALLLGGEGDVVADLLEDVLLGEPS